MVENEQPLDRYRGARIVVLATAILLFAGLFLSSYGFSRPTRSAVAKTITNAGTYGKYSYLITAVRGQATETVVFTPAVMSDDATVIGGLQEILRAAYGDKNYDQIQPVVETIGEKPYVTFTSAGHKTYFQLYKGDAGELGSAKFWRVDSPH